MIALGEKRDTKTTYGEVMGELGEQYENLACVEVDLIKASGNTVFPERHPEKVFDLGIAEQNSLSFSAGLASMGKLVFASGFACFMAQRACDQAVSSVAYNNFNVKVVGTYPGLTSEKNGGTHISTNDVTIYRAIPRFEVYDPGDANEYEAVLKYAARHEGPVYIRANKTDLPCFTPKGREFVPGKAEVLKEGSDVAVITSGITTLEGIYAANQLEEQGKNITLIHMASIKPIDREAVLKAAAAHKVLITVENQTVNGGLGSAVAEVLAEEGCTAKLVRLGLQDHFGETATLAYMMHKYRIDRDAILEEVRKVLG